MKNKVKYKWTKNYLKWIKNGWVYYLRNAVGDVIEGFLKLFIGLGYLLLAIPHLIFELILRIFFDIGNIIKERRNK